MKKFAMLFIALMTSVLMFGQPTGYYNGTEGLTGEELKASLNDIISDHFQFDYSTSSSIFKLSDADPNNPNNVILVYTGRSEENNNYGTGGDYINREHVWAKSHGGFADIAPMHNDVHNLKPADASVNSSRGYKDFDNGGEQHPEATGCYFTSSTWEPRDEVKGDIARIILYMDTRYEGNNGESDLSVVDYIDTYPAPEHGKLSTLLEWNNFDPPDEFERNRNDVIFSWQKNRNPFIDNPEFVNLIWEGQQPSTISFSDFSISDDKPIANQPVDITANVASTAGPLTGIELRWGLDYDNLDHIETMGVLGNDQYATEISGQNGDETVYYQIIASDATNTFSSIIYNYYVIPVFNGDLTTIYNIQGQTDISPFEGQIVNTTGIVTANFGENYYIQDGTGAWNGVFVYELGRNPNIGDSIIITGLVEEYYDKTEIKEISGFYYISSDHDLPEPVNIATNQGGESYESVLVNVNNAVCTDADYPSNFGMWRVNDGSGDMLVHNSPVFGYEPVENEAYDVTGPLNYDFDEWKIELRYESDVTDGTDFIAPTVLAVEPISETIVKVSFSENVEEAIAETISNYTINNGIEVLEASRHAIIHANVFLTVSEMETNNYTIVIENIEDYAGNVMELAENNFPFTSGINDLFNEANISFFPNPATDFFTLSIPALSNVDRELNLTISNIAGQTIIEKQISVQNQASNYNINISSLEGGVYILRISDANNFGVRRLVIK